MSKPPKPAFGQIWRWKGGSVYMAIGPHPNFKSGMSWYAIRLDTNDRHDKPLPDWMGLALAHEGGSHEWECIEE